jgi:phosphate transport system permease protein
MIYLSAFLALSALFYVFGYVISKGAPSLNLEFFTSNPKPVGEDGGGMLNAVMGTINLILIAAAIGIPWGVLTGVFLSEYGRGTTAQIVRFSTEMLASVPSIVVGLFVHAILVVPMGGFSTIAGSVALSIIMIPTIAKTTEELLRLVPVHIREAGLALGLPRWKVILRIVVRGSLGGITTGVMLAVARAAGETAPLIFTALNNQMWLPQLKQLIQPVSSLPVQIYTFAISPFEEQHRLAWTGALVLVLVVFTLNLMTRIFLRPAPSGRE